MIWFLTGVEAGVEPHLLALGDHFWLLVALKDSDMVLEFESESAACKTSALTPVLSLQPSYRIKLKKNKMVLRVNQVFISKF